ncbi:MAG: ankyrin repeat domain-containing protein, partial [Nitrosopumilus sp.]
MQAKFVYEAIGDILKPKSEEDIMSLIGDLSPNKLLVKSVTSGFLPGVKEALKNGADIHTGGEYALQRASQFGHYDIVKLLLKHDANVHAWNDFPLRWASNNGHYDIVKLLL